MMFRGEKKKIVKAEFFSPTTYFLKKIKIKIINILIHMNGKIKNCIIV